MNTPVDPKAAEAEATQLPAVIPQSRRREPLVVSDPIAVLDTAKFEQIQRVATVMANCNFIPDALCKANNQWLEPTAILSNCFMVVNQAVRWGMDPFAVAQCVSVVHGKLCYEGKLIAGLIDAKLGIRLRYEWSGAGENMKIKVLGTFPDGTTESIEGTVSEWKTTHKGSPWTPAQYRKMLAYRGAREWARLYAPGLMLGVYSPDEMESLNEDSRGNRARDVTNGSAHDDDTPPAPPPRQIAQQEAPPTAPASNGAATTMAQADPVDTSFVELASNETKPTASAPVEDDNPPDPSSRQTEQSSPAATGKPSPAASPVPTDTTPAGEVSLSKALLLKSLAEVDSVMKLEAWLDENGRDMADLEGPDQREVESAFNKRESELRNPKKK